MSFEALCTHLRLFVREGLAQGRFSYCLCKMVVYCSKNLFTCQCLANPSRQLLEQLVQTFLGECLHLFTTCLHVLFICLNCQGSHLGSCPERSLCRNTPVLRYFNFSLKCFFGTVALCLNAGVFWIETASSIATSSPDTDSIA